MDPGQFKVNWVDWGKIAGIFDLRFPCAPGDGEMRVFASIAQFRNGSQLP
jgi:hypothetical protein